VSESAVSVLEHPEARHAARVRLAGPADVAFIISTWKQSFKFGSPWANRIRWHVFDEGHTPIVKRMMGRSSIWVACDPSDEMEILGYLVAELNARVIHYVYVKPMFRRAGICGMLFDEVGIPRDLARWTVTHATSLWLTTLEKKCPLCTHDPYRGMTCPET
jgi:hypothetical protein